MKIPLTTLLPPQAKALWAALKAIPWRLLLEVCMLVAIYLLWSWLGEAKVDLGKAEATRDQAKAALVVCQDEKQKLAESQKVTDEVVSGNQQADQLVDDQTRKLLKQLQELKNAKKCTGPSVGQAQPADPDRDRGFDGLDRLLDMATCTAKQNGIPCTPRSTSAPL